MAFFVAMCLISVFAMLWDPTLPPQRRLTMAVVTGGFWCLMASLSAYLIGSCLREVWRVDRWCIEAQGLVRRVAIPMNQIVEARWVCAPRGKVVLRTRDQTLRIPFETFTQDERLWLIRSHVPESIQANWDQFCGGVAVPLTRRPVGIDEPLTVHQVRLSRFRFDLYFSVLFCCTLLLAIFQCRDVEIGRRIGAPLMALVLWMAFRFRIPKQGLIAPRWTFEWKSDRWFVALLAWGAMPMAWLLAHRARAHDPLPVSSSLILGLVGWFAVVLFIASRIDRINAIRRREQRRIAARNWREHAV